MLSPPQRCVPSPQSWQAMLRGDLLVNTFCQIFWKAFNLAHQELDSIAELCVDLGLPQTGRVLVGAVFSGSFGKLFQNASALFVLAGQRTQLSKAFSLRQYSCMSH